MDISILFSKLFERNPVLTWAGIINFTGFALTILLSFIDKRKVSGVNVWLKPMKFFFSIAIYLFTMSWILFYLSVDITVISISIAALMYFEMLLIFFQAARGTTSHFNTSSTFNIIIYASMGVAITLNTIVCAYVLYLFFMPEVKIAGSYLWGIRAGLFIFIIASLEGFAMTKRNSHTVNAKKDEGKGLPFLNWSREGGDLRVAHFIGIHALQVLPFIAVFVKSVTVILIISIIYFIISIGLFLQAIKGKVFLSFIGKIKESNAEAS